MNLIDTHCHLSHRDLHGALDDVLARAAAAGVTRVICAAGDLRESAASLALARRRPNLFALAGLHPHEAKDFSPETPAALEALLADPLVVALGEIGLDYFHDHSPRPVQREVFAAQLALARRAGKPVVVHSRDAFDDTLAVLRESGLAGSKILFHSFSEGPEQARRALDLGACLAFSGMVTFKGKDLLRASALLVPADRLLIETDSPYLSPEPLRGRFPNEPARVLHVATALASLRNQPIDLLASQTTAAASAFFSLPDLDG